MTKPLKLVMFDCDGTLANSHAFLVRVAKESFAHVGATVPLESRMNDFLSMTFEDFLKTLDGHMTGEQLQKAYDHMRATLVGERDSGAIVEPVYDGIKEMLKTLYDQNYLLGVATNKQAHGLAAVLKTNGIDRYFVTLQNSSNSATKPSPDMILNAMAATGADRKDTVLVGDSTIDIQTGKNAGVKVIGVTWGSLSEDRILAAGADCLARTPAEVVDRVRELLA